MKTSGSGWAIKWGYTDSRGVFRAGLLSTLYFHLGGAKHLEGCSTAVFRTRQLARDAACQAGRGYDRATAVRVRVTVEEVV